MSNVLPSLVETFLSPSHQVLGGAGHDAGFELTILFVSSAGVLSDEEEAAIAQSITYKTPT